MTHRTTRTRFPTRAEAENDQRDRGVPGYSERYPRGIVEVRQTDGTVVYTSVVEEYHG